MFELASEVFLQRETTHLGVQLLFIQLNKQGSVKHDRLQLDALSCLSCAIKLQEKVNKCRVGMGNLASTIEEKYKTDDLIANECEIGRLINVDNRLEVSYGLLQSLMTFWDTQMQGESGKEEKGGICFWVKSDINYYAFRRTLQVFDFLAINYSPLEVGLRERALVSFYFGIIHSQQKVSPNEQETYQIEKQIHSFFHSAFGIELTDQKKTIKEFQFLGGLPSCLDFPDGDCDCYQEYLQIQTHRTFNV